MSGVVQARVPCPRCGDIRLPIAHLRLTPGRGGRPGSYEFTCPSCGHRVVRRADARVARVLARHDVPLADSLLAQELRSAGIEAEVVDDQER